MNGANNVSKIIYSLHTDNSGRKCSISLVAYESDYIKMYSFSER